MIDSKSTSDELAHQRSLLEAVMETSVDGILVVGEQREYVTWNRRFVEMWGVPEELVGDETEELALEWAQDQVADPAAFLEKVEYLYEHPDEESWDEVRLEDGRVFDRYSAPVKGDDGTHYGRVWFFRDVTGRVKREEELARQNQRLEEFASVVSHDLRNPLNVASGRLELALEEFDSGHLESAANAIDRSFSLIDDLLTIAREGAEVSDTEPLELAALSRGCWENVETGDGTLLVRTDRTILADSGPLKQLLENLIRNAIEHGGDAVTVTVGDRDDGFYVEDDGQGIPPEKRDDILENGYSTSDEGTGFGLSIVRHVAEAHDWTIHVTEGSDGGARFEFTGVEFPAG